MLRPILIALAIATAPALAAKPGSWTVGPAPSWVDQAGPEETKAKPPSPGGYRCLLHEQQVLQAPGRYGRFEHRLYRLETVEGARTFDGFSLDYDPSWQRVVYHWVKVKRDGRILDRLDPSKIRALTREDGLDQGQIDGRQTLHMVLEDLRPGDELDFAWSLEGQHPAFPRVASGSFRLAMPWSVDRLRERLVWMFPESPRTQAFNGAPQPVATTTDGVRSLVWEVRDVAARKEVEHAPDWWDDEPSVDWTNLPDWSAIAGLQTPFYAAADRPDPKAVALADRIARSDTAPEVRVVRVLRFLQDSIRYLGYEGGLGSHIPRPTSVTLASRQGDCKDKSLLMVALLRRMGIEAHPALVLSSGDRDLDQHLPSPWFFDHVIVAVRVRGETRFLDPTDRDQHGSLANIPAVPCRWALILEPGSAGLTEIAHPALADPEYDLRETWDARQGPEHPARLERTLVRRGRSAETFRERIAKSSLKEEADAELERLKSTYPDLRRVGEPEAEEDDSTGWVTWRSVFESDGFWKQQGSSAVWKFSVAAPMVKDLAWDPGDVEDRKAPLLLVHPGSAKVSIQVLLPHRGWADERNEDEPGLSSLDYRFQSHLRPDTFDLSWSWNSLRDHVPSGDLKPWKAAMDSIRSETEWTITLDRRSWTSKVNWPVVFLIPFLLCIGIRACRRFLAWSPRPPARVRTGTEAWMSGWWGLYLLGLAVLPVRNAIALWDAGWILDPSRWNASLEANGTIALCALLECGVFLVLLPVWYSLFRLFLGRRSAFPLANALVFGSLALWLVADAVVLLGAGAENAWENLGTTAWSLPSTIIWIVYFLRAERSKAFFRNRADGTKVEIAS